MVRVIVIVREIGRLSPDYGLPFDLPEIPKVGDYISVFRPDATTRTEDVIVRHVWWQLDSPERLDDLSTREPRAGKIKEITLECDVAVGPWAGDHWLKLADAGRQRGAVEEFEVARVRSAEADLKL